jgi:hypothetical protein
MEIQAASGVAVHVHSRETATASVPLPPSAPKLDDELVIVAWHRDVVGAVTVDVVAELPHAVFIAAAATIANSRGPFVTFTAPACSSRGPATIGR